MAASSKKTKFGQRMPSKKAHVWILGRIPLTNNELLKSHWRKKERDKKSWREWVAAVARRGPWHHDKYQAPRVVVKITVYRWNLQDKENLYGSTKHLTDAIVRAGWARDDSHRWMDLEVRERIDRKERRTEVYWEVL